MRLTLVIIVLLGATLAQAKLAEDFSSSKLWEIENLQTQREFFFNWVDKAAENLKVYILKHLNILTARLEKLVEAVMSEILHFGEYNLHGLARATRVAKAKLLTNRGPNAKDCQESYQQELENFFTKTKREHENCIVNATRNVYNIQQQVQINIDNVTLELNNLLNVSNKCVQILKPLTTSACFLKHFREIRNSVQGVILNSYSAIKEASIQLYKIIGRTKACSRSVVREAEIQLKEITLQIDTCLKFGSTEKPTSEHPTTEQPTTEQPTTEQPTTEQPTTKQPTTEHPTTEQTTTEQPTTQQPTTEQPTTKQPTTEQPTTEQPTTEQPTTKQPTTEQEST